MFKIEKGVPAPGSPGAPVTGLTQALRNMEVGDSLVYPKASRNGFYSCARMVPNTKFVTRSVSDTEFRIWRVQ